MCAHVTVAVSTLRLDVAWVAFFFDNFVSPLIESNQIMRTFSLLAGAIALAMPLLNHARAEIISFEDKSLSANSFYNGGPVTNSNGWTSGGAFFNNAYDSSFGGFWSGWSYSNVQNTTTPGVDNQYAAFAGSGFGGSGNYAVAYQSATTYINLPQNFSVQSTRISNTTYAALSLLNGDAFSKKFGGATGNDPDFFKLTIHGYDSGAALGNITGTREVYLADYRSANNVLDFVVSDWQLIDLTQLGNARSLGFSLSSSDNGQFGMNTPAYFALDQITIVAVPEPSTLASIGSILAIGYMVRRSRKPQFQNASEFGM
jgi:Domain of unknown function (DUF4465)